MTTLSPAQFQQRLLAWFDQHGRKTLPWQQNKTPYRVWVSEIMLQQTQVKTAIPYFQRFMTRFPTLNTLANASDNDVLHAWAGLGYYSRARNLHRAANMVIADYRGRFPNELETLQTLPGIGPSTAGAILAIAFEKQATILDGNVKRVLTRLHGIDAPINQRKTEDMLWELAVRYTPKKRIADYTQAIMDLGATFCTRSQPQCETCPFKKVCVAHLENLTEQIPHKTKAKKLPVKQATFLILKHGDQVFVQKRPSPGIWGGLYSFPELPDTTEIQAVKQFCQQQWQQAISKHHTLPLLRHTFSHYHLDIHPIVLDIKKVAANLLEDGNSLWYNLNEPMNVGLPKPVQTLLRRLS